MKKHWLLFSLLLFGSCSSGVSQEDFIALKEEVGSLKSENEILIAENEELKNRLGEGGTEEIKTVYVTQQDLTPVLYESDLAKVSVQSTFYSSSYGGPEVILIAENKTEKDILVDLKRFSFGGYNIYGYFNTNLVYAQTTTKIDYDWPLSQLEDFGNPDWSGFSCDLLIAYQDNPDEPFAIVKVDFARNIFN